MAKLLHYEPQPPPPPTPEDAAHAEWDALLVELHRSGTLRLLRGLLGAGPEVTKVALDQLERPAGGRLVRNVTVLLSGASRFEPEHLDHLLTGLARGVTAASRRLAGKPPGPLRLLRTLADGDVRRGIGAVLALVAEIGAATGPRPQRQPRSTSGGR